MRMRSSRTRWWASPRWAQWPRRTVTTSRAGEVHVDLDRRVAVGPVEHDERALAVVVDLGALAELLGVLDAPGAGISMSSRERVEVGVARVVEVEPEELLALVQGADGVGVDPVEQLHLAPTLPAGADGVTSTTSRACGLGHARPRPRARPGALGRGRRSATRSARRPAARRREAMRRPELSAYTKASCTARGRVAADARAAGAQRVGQACAPGVGQVRQQLVDAG